MTRSQLQVHTRHVHASLRSVFGYKLNGQSTLMDLGIPNPGMVQLIELAGLHASLSLSPNSLVSVQLHLHLSGPEFQGTLPPVARQINHGLRTLHLLPHWELITQNNQAELAGCPIVYPPNWSVPPLASPEPMPGEVASQHQLDHEIQATKRKWKQAILRCTWARHMAQCWADLRQLSSSHDSPSKWENYLRDVLQTWTHAPTAEAASLEQTYLEFEGSLKGRPFPLAPYLDLLSESGQQRPFLNHQCRGA